MPSYLSLMPLCSLVLMACTETSPVVEKPVQAAAPKPVVETKKQQPAQVVKPKPIKKGSLTSIDMGRLFSMSQTGKALIIDVRPPLYYRLGHIDGAESLPLIKYDKIIESKRTLLDAAAKSGKVIVLYCQNINCPDAHKTGLKLIDLGYSASVYRGGWEEWKEAGF